MEPEAAYLLCTLPDGARVALRHGILPYEYPLRRYTLHALDACGELAGELPTNRGEARLLWKTAQRKNREVNLLLAAGEEIARKEANRLVQDKARNSIQSLD